MQVYNPDDIAIEPTNDVTEEEKILYQDEKQRMKESQSGIVKLIGSDITNLKPGDSIYIDPNGSCFIEELNLIVCHKNNILLKGDE